MRMLKYKMTKGEEVVIVTTYDEMLKYKAEGFVAEVLLEKYVPEWGEACD